MREDGANPTGTTTTIRKVQFNPIRYNLPTLLALTVPRCEHTDDAFKVREYLDDVEEVGNNHSMTDGEIIGMALYYADRGLRLLWKVFVDDIEDDWSKFKQEVMKFYPDAIRSEDTCKIIAYDLADAIRGQYQFRSQRMGLTISAIRQFCIQFLYFVNDVQPRLHLSDSRLCYLFAAGLSSAGLSHKLLETITPKMRLGLRYSLQSLFEDFLKIWWEDFRESRESYGFISSFNNLNELATQWERNLSL